MTEVIDITDDELDDLVDEVATEELDATLDLIAVETANECGLNTSPSKDAARSLKDRGWQATYSALFGSAFVLSLAPHHVEAVEWHWESRIAFLEGRRPDYLAYFPIWSRGHMKSTLAERIVVVDAWLSCLYDQPGFCLYLGREKDKVQENISNIETLLSSEPVRRFFPALSEVKRNEETNQKRRWAATFLHTKAGYIVKGGTIESAQAGSRIGSTRPTLILPDDIDGREDSAVISEAKFKRLTTEILPMRQGNTLVFWAQNLISRYTAMYRIQKQHARVLTNRKPTQPVPAVLNLKTDTRTVDGIVKDVYVSGEPTWAVWDAARIQDEIETEGLPSFLRECQHEVEQDSEGLVLKNYDDAVHVISESEFESIFGTREIPRRWYKYVFNDWARTKTKFHANVTGTLTVSGQNEPLPGCVFFFHPASYPAGTAPEEVAVRLLSTITPGVQTEGGFFTWKDLMRAVTQGAGLEHLVHDTTRFIEEKRKLLANVIPERVAPILKAQNYHLFRGSHEQNSKKDLTGALTVYRKVFGLPFTGTNPGGDGGVDIINLLMKVDYSLEHRVRPGQMGYTNFFIVVPDDRSQPPVFVTEEGIEVYPPVPYNESLTPDDLHDHDLLRYQIKNCRHRDPQLTAAGEQEGGILKLNDDFINGMMMLFYDNCVQAAPMTYDEQVTEATPEKLRVENLQKESPYDAGLLPHQEMSALLARRFAEQRITPRVQQWDEWGNPVG